MHTSTALPAPSLLQLIWLASPALPVGGFSYSEGLEAAVNCGLVSSEAHAAHWLSDQMGRSLAQWHQALNDTSAAALQEFDKLSPNGEHTTYPIAFALAASSTQASVRD